MLKVGFFLLFLYIFSESKTAANNKKKDTKATGENATSTDAQSTNQNVGRTYSLSYLETFLPN